jgi:hypothetical protein
VLIRLVHAMPKFKPGESALKVLSREVFEQAGREVVCPQPKCRVVVE